MTPLLLYTAGVLILTLIELRRQRRAYDKLRGIDGCSVYYALTDKAKRRTSPDNVSDVLDAIDVVAPDERVWQ